MNETQALQLIKDYIQGWKTNDLSRISSCLTEKCMIVESHGPLYCGIKRVKQLYDLWVSEENSIEAWDIITFYYLDKAKTGFCEWKLSFCNKNAQFTVLGISVVKYTTKKISYVHEYRMTKPKFLWQESTLLIE